MSSEMMRQEVQEAIAAGERALVSLNAAQDKLNSARGWGIVDLLGGGFITDMIKHSKMREAAQLIESAKYDLRLFEKELNDVQIAGDLKLEIGGFLSFADFFFDGLVADYLVQSKIADARAEVEDAICRVEQLLEDLENALR